MLHHIRFKHASSPEAKTLEIKMKNKSNTLKKKKETLKQSNQLKVNEFFPAKTNIPIKVKNDIDRALEDFVVGNNESFSLCENPLFRNLIFKANPGYIAPSRRSLTRRVDQRISDMKVALKAELIRDVQKFKRVSITSDGGPSHNKMNTKKNSVTVHRIDANWNLQTDTLALPVAEGSQTGPVIRKQVKDVLDACGYDEEWSVCFTTHGASNVRSARAVGRHANYWSYCHL